MRAHQGRTKQRRKKRRKICQKHAAKKKKTWFVTHCCRPMLSPLWRETNEVVLGANDLTHMHFRKSFIWEKCGTWKHSNTCQWIGSTYSLVWSKQAAGAPNEAKKNSNAAAERFLMKMTRQAKNANIFVFGGIRFCFGSTTSWALRQWNIERLHNGNRIRA